MIRMILEYVCSEGGIMVLRIVEVVQKFFLEVLGEKCRVSTVLKEEENWKVVCEVNIDTEYTTRRGLGDLVEVYDVFLNHKLEIMGYDLKNTKKRGTIDADR